MKFPPVEDIPDIETTSFNINKLDKEMDELIRDARFAVTHNYELSRRSRELVSTLDSLLEQQTLTHNSMRLLLRRAYRKSEYSLVADTASLAREQVEKIYQAVILSQGPRHWLRQYLRNDWQHEYEQYLLELDEYGAIDRHQEHLYERYPAYLENMKKIKLHSNDSILVSDFAKRVVEYNWHYRKGTQSVPKPAWFKRKGSVSSFLASYFFFPTPWAVMTKVKSQKLLIFLDRWYREYKMLSQYTHVLVGKIMAGQMARYKSIAATEKNRIYGRKKAEAFILTSNIAAASLVTVIMPYLKNDYGSKRATKEYWEELCKGSLFAKGLWKLYAEKVLG